jgi:murein L,D-transpeptidase YafK
MKRIASRQTVALSLLLTLGLGTCSPRPAGADRARAATARKASVLAALFRARGVAYPPREVFLRVFKREATVELWARGRGAAEFRMVKAYPVCAASGDLGPKRRSGDAQVPEGFYFIDRFNPWSGYHLSLGIDYPNASDRMLGARGSLGGDIFIHGSCASIGCVSITDDLIEEVYVAASAARARGQRIPVHIFPTRLDAAGMAWLAKRYAGRPQLLRFWANLKPGFDAFEQRRVPPRVRVDARGAYRLVPPAVAARPTAATRLLG